MQKLDNNLRKTGQCSIADLAYEKAIQNIVTNFKVDKFLDVEASGRSVVSYLAILLFPDKKKLLNLIMEPENKYQNLDHKEI